MREYRLWSDVIPGVMEGILGRFLRWNIKENGGEGDTIFQGDKVTRIYEWNGGGRG